ncbi:MAG: c-type cytochrome [Betaproteobacteria bacterium]|nr:c-type cytochrome [Betaproteobacteria bacterium]
MRFSLSLLCLCVALSSLSRTAWAQADERFVSLLAYCSACHGADGAGAIPEAPALGGQNEHYLLEMLRRLRSDQGHSAIMRGTTSDLTDNDLQQLASYFASLPYLRTPQPVDPQKSARGGAVYLRVCGFCHFNSGRSSVYENIPLLAGQNIIYMLSQLDLIMDQQRHVDIVKRGMLERVTREELEAALHYFASQQVAPDEVVTSRIRAAERKKRSR